MAEEENPPRRGARKKVLDNILTSFGYWYGLINFFKSLNLNANFRETENIPNGEFIPASTFMPHPHCNVSGGGKIFMIFK